MVPLEELPLNVKDDGRSVNLAQEGRVLVVLSGDDVRLQIRGFFQLCHRVGELFLVGNVMRELTADPIDLG